jgi:hypothetical protein
MTPLRVRMFSGDTVIPASCKAILKGYSDSSLLQDR